jgi:uncharacterized Zn finger protein
MERKELMGLIGAPATPKGKSPPNMGYQVEMDSAGKLPAAPLPREPEAFWGKGDPRGDFLSEVRIPTVNIALIKRLGNFPFWRGDESFADALEGVYREAARVGMDVFLGEPKVGSPA